MNDHDLDRALDAIYQGRADLADPPQLHERAFAVPTEYPQRRGWLPHIDTRGFPMFAALKFVAAGVTVALFGGFLLTGVLPTPQEGEAPPAAVTASPTTVDEAETTALPTDRIDISEPVVLTDILPGVELTVEEVEPGVFRILNDGVRDLASLSNWHVPEWQPDIDDDRKQFLDDLSQALEAVFQDLVVGHDGSVWLRRAEDFVRLGSDERYDLPEGWDRRLVVAPDGTVWVSSTVPGSSEGEEVTRLHSLEDGAWTTRPRAPDIGSQALTFAPDGTIWATHPAKSKEKGVTVTRLGADGWEPLPQPAPDEGELFVTESGEIWIAPGAMGRGLQRRDANGVWHEDGPWRTIAKRGDLWRYRDDRSGWQGVPVRAMVFRPFTSDAEVGADGTVWYVGIEPRMRDGKPVLEDGRPMPGESFLMRFDGTDWQRWGPTDGVPSLLGAIVTVGLEQGPDGALWMVVHDADPEHGAGQADIARFDGSGWRHVLRGHGVDSWDMQIAPDGTVWLLASGDARAERANGLYVITPEAVAATE